MFEDLFLWKKKKKKNALMYLIGIPLAYYISLFKIMILC